MQVIITILCLYLVIMFLVAYKWGKKGTTDDNRNVWWYRRNEQKGKKDSLRSEIRKKVSKWRHDNNGNKKKKIKNKQDNDLNTKEFIFVYDKMFLYACEHTAVQYANTHAAKMRIKGWRNVCPTQCSTALINTALIKYIY